MPIDKITIKGAREHNLKNINLEIPSFVRENRNTSLSRMRTGDKAADCRSDS